MHNPPHPVRLGAALGGTPATWLHLQASYDLWHAERALKRQVAKIERINSAA
jgi:plasmid maintenance system antidote protein VapI